MPTIEERLASLEEDLRGHGAGSLSALHPHNRLGGRVAAMTAPTEAQVWAWQDLRGRWEPRTIGWDAVIAPHTGTDIQDAFDAGAKSILLLDGTHNVTGNITLPTGVSLGGQSMLDTIIEFGDADRRFIIDGAFNLIENFTVDGSTSTAGTFDSSSSSLTVRRVRVQDCTTGASATSGFPLLENVLFTAPKGTDDWIAGPWFVQNCTITASTNSCINGGSFVIGCKFTVGAVTALKVTSGTLQIVGSRIDAGDGGGICALVSSSGSMIATNVTFSGPPDDGSHNVSVIQSGRLVLNGCTLSQGDHVVNLASDGNIVTGCRILNGADGVNIDGDHDGNVIQGNTINDNSGRGVYVVNSQANGTIIIGNTFSGNGGDEIFNAGTSSQIAFNFG